MTNFEIFQRGLDLIDKLKAIDSAALREEMNKYTDKGKRLEIHQGFYRDNSKHLNRLHRNDYLDHDNQESMLKDLYTYLVNYRSRPDSLYHTLPDEDKEIYDKFTDFHWQMRFEAFKYTGDNPIADFVAVYHIPIVNMYVGFFGNSSSYGGTSYAYMSEVKPKTVTIETFGPVDED